MNHEDATLALLMERSKKMVPNLLALKAKVDEGETLGELEIIELEELAARARHMQRVYDDHPEVQELVAMAVDVYSQIVEKALHNEQDQSH